MSFSRFHPLHDGGSSSTQRPSNINDIYKRYDDFEESITSSRLSSTQGANKEVYIRNIPSINERTLTQMIISQGFKPVSINVDRVFNPIGRHQVDAKVEFDSLMTAQAWITMNQGFFKFSDGTKCSLELSTENIVNHGTRIPSPPNKGEEPMRMSPSPEPYESGFPSSTGDWICSRCAFENFRGMQECGSCQLQKPMSEIYESLPLPERMRFNETLSSMPGLIPPMPAPMKQEAKVKVGPPPAVNWSCPQCGGSNPEDIEICKRCKKPAYGANMVGNVPCDTVLFYDLPSDASEIKIKMCLEDYKRQSLRIHLVSEKKYCLVQMPSVDEATMTVKDFDRKAPKIGHRRILVAFSRKPLNAILMEMKLEAYKNQAMLKTQNALNKKVQQNPDIKNPLLPQVKTEILSDSRGLHNVSKHPKTEYFHFDRTSGYFFDPATGYYYDAKSESYFNPMLKEWLFWSSKSGTYKSFNAPNAHNLMSEEMLLQQIETQKYIQQLHSQDCNLVGQSVPIACDMFKVFMNQSRFIFQLFADKLVEDSHREALQNFEWQMLELRQAVALDMYRQNAPPLTAPEDILPPPRMDLQAFTPSVNTSLVGITPAIASKDEIGEAYKLITGMDPLSIQLRHLVPDGNVKKENLRLCRKCGRVGHSKVTCQYHEEVNEDTVSYMSRLIDAYKKIHHMDEIKEEKVKPSIPAIASATGDIKDVRYMLNLQEAFKTPESRVIHVRNLRPEVTEDELKKILAPFGSIFDIYMLPPTKSNQGQALVEFETLEASRACAKYGAPVIIMGQRVYFEYGNRQRITKPPTQTQKKLEGGPEMVPLRKQLEPEPEAKKPRSSSDYENYLMESYISIKERSGEPTSALANDPDFRKFVEDPKYREFLERRKEKLRKFGIL